MLTSTECFFNVTWNGKRHSFETLQFLIIQKLHSTAWKFFSRESQTVINTKQQTYRAYVTLCINHTHVNWIGFACASRNIMADTDTCSLHHE